MPFLHICALDQCERKLVPMDGSVASQQLRSLAPWPSWCICICICIRARACTCTCWCWRASSLPTSTKNKNKQAKTTSTCFPCLLGRTVASCARMKKATVLDHLTNQTTSHICPSWLGLASPRPLYFSSPTLPNAASTSLLCYIYTRDTAHWCVWCGDWPGLSSSSPLPHYSSHHIIISSKYVRMERMLARLMQRRSSPLSGLLHHNQGGAAAAAPAGSSLFFSQHQQQQQQQHTAAAVQPGLNIRDSASQVRTSSLSLSLSSTAQTDHSLALTFSCCMLIIISYS